tara:strand:+ start:794 stop:1120 length:327 start_codon:yes stop_codon:yes gene_type:complete
MGLTLKARYKAYHPIIVPRGSNMSLKMDVDIETGHGRIYAEFCGQAAEEAPRILRFLAKMTDKYSLRVDQLDLDGTCRFRVLGQVMPAMKAFKTEAKKIRALIDESDK